MVKYKTEVNMLLRALCKPNALITDSTRFIDLIPNKKLDKKTHTNLHKIETKYKLQIMIDDNISDIAEKMYNYLPF